MLGEIVAMTRRAAPSAGMANSSSSAGLCYFAAPTRASRSSRPSAACSACKAANSKKCEIARLPDTPHAFNADYRPS
jgi:hypothetical protein